MCDEDLKCGCWVVGIDDYVILIVVKGHLKRIVLSCFRKGE